MINREKVKNHYGRIVGFIDTDTATGNKTIRDFYGVIKGRYVKKQNLTKDHAGRIVAFGDQSSMLIDFNPKR